jgi:hypothetical protein
VLRHVGVGSVRSEPGRSADEILAIATVVGCGPSVDDRPRLGSMYEKGDWAIELLASGSGYIAPLLGLPTPSTESQILGLQGDPP